MRIVAYVTLIASDVRVAGGAPNPSQRRLRCPVEHSSTFPRARSRLTEVTGRAGRVLVGARRLNWSDVVGDTRPFHHPSPFIGAPLKSG